jgi:transcriptional regulator with XRE-family HTH domain
LAGRLRAFRVRRGLTQQQLADQLGVTQQSVARWEQGSPPRRYLIQAMESLLQDQAEPGDGSDDLAQIIGIRPPALRPVTRGADQQDARRTYVRGCLKLLERGERLPNRVLLLLADELGFADPDA